MQVTRGKSSLPLELWQNLRFFFFFLDILESCIIALVNKSDWEFVMSMAGGPSLPMEVQVSQLLLSIVICTKVCTVHESQEGCSISMNECHEV